MATLGRLKGVTSAGFQRMMLSEAAASRAVDHLDQPSLIKSSAFIAKDRRAHDRRLTTSWGKGFFAQRAHRAGAVNAVFQRLSPHGDIKGADAVAGPKDRPPPKAVGKQLHRPAPPIVTLRAATGHAIACGRRQVATNRSIGGS
jgi:hypothetical protein